MPRDAVTTKQNVKGDYAEKLPADRITTSCRCSRASSTNADGTPISIRGGRTDEASTYVDGVPVRRRATASSGVSPARQRRRVDRAFEDASVTTGGRLGRVRRRPVGRHRDLDPVRRLQVGRQLRIRDRRDLRQQRQPRLQPGHASLGGPIVVNLTFFVAGTSKAPSRTSAASIPRRARSSCRSAPTPWWRCSTPRRSELPATRGHDLRPGIELRGLHRQLRRTFKASQNSDIREQLRPRLPGHPGSRHGEHDLPAAGQAELHLRRRFPRLPDGVAVERPGRRPFGYAQSTIRRTASPTEPEQRRHPGLDPEPVQVGGPGPGARPLRLVPVGPGHHRTADPASPRRAAGIRGAGSSSRRSTSCSTSRTSRSIRWWTTSSSQHRHADPVRPGSDQPVRGDQRVQEQRVRRDRLRRVRRPGRPNRPVQGRPVHRQGRRSTGRWTGTTGSSWAASTPSTT